MLLPETLRKDFPLLEREIDGRPLIYFDSAATALKPRAVIDAVMGFYCHHSANVHRSVHQLSEEATEAYEAAREAVARFINADAREVAFTRNATEAINIVAHAKAGRGSVGLTMSEHHSNLLPWQQGQHFFFPTTDEFKVDLERAEEMIVAHRPRLIALATISNALGVRQPVEELISLAHEHDCEVLLDLSQSVGHEVIDVAALDCDYAAFSGHKMLGPSGVGVLYQREGVTEPIGSHYLGGEMIHQAHIDGYEARPFPWGLEAGTPNIEGVIGLGAAAEYLESIGIEAIARYNALLAQRMREGLARLDRIRLSVPPSAAEGTSIVAFTLEGFPAQGLARVMSNRFAIMIRSGFHCAQPLHEVFGMPESSRASLHFYNTEREIDTFLEALAAVQRSI